MKIRKAAYNFEDGFAYWIIIGLLLLTIKAHELTWCERMRENEPDCFNVTNNATIYMSS